MMQSSAERRIAALRISLLRSASSARLRSMRWPSWLEIAPSVCSSSRIGQRDLRAEKLEHVADFAIDRDRDGEGRRHAACQRELGIRRSVRFGDRSAIHFGSPEFPDLAREPLAAAAGPCAAVASSNSPISTSGALPDLHAAQDSAVRIHVPHDADVPLERFRRSSAGSAAAPPPPSPRRRPPAPSHTASRRRCSPHHRSETSSTVPSR